MKMKLLFFLVLAQTIQFELVAQTSIVGAGKKVDPYAYEITKNAIYNRAAVSSAHPLASQIGAVIMEQGGNAFDAAIATQLALAVVYPGAGNIGGGGFLIGHQANGTTIGIDFREAAPSAASKDMYLDKNGNAQLSLSQSGHLASGIPGTIAGLFATMTYAKLPFSQLIQPAIDLAEKGFVITEKQASSFNSNREAFLKNNSLPIAFVKETKWKVGDTLIQKSLAATLKRIQTSGAKGFYEGETAQLIVAEMQRGKGIISLDDLKKYSTKTREPISFNYRGYQILSFAPPSSGGIIINQLFKMIEKYPVASYGFQTVKSVQLMIEAQRRAFADRAAHMGDPDFWKVPVKTLTSDAYIAKRMQDYNPEKASVSENINAGVIHESNETTHISIIDAEGNMASITTTLNGGYGSKVVVSGAGFLLNNEMDDFSVKPGTPNMFGAVGGEANAIVPGKRMLSSMTPTLVLKNKKPYVVIGTPGGTTIPTAVFETLVNILDFNMNASDAINKPKFHHQWLPDEVLVEKDFDANVVKQLQGMGYIIKEVGGIGRTELIRLLSNGKKETAADKRGDDAVAGF
jgi:gamma-glutamyltranspeptidase / glutathione hydrolase